MATKGSAKLFHGMSWESSKAMPIQGSKKGGGSDPKLAKKKEPVMMERGKETSILTVSC